MPLYPPASNAGLTPIVAVYSTTAGQTISATTTSIIDFGTQVVDTASAVTTGSSWHFTAPEAGTYMVSVTTTFINAAVAIDTAFPLGVYVNGSVVRYLSQERLQNGMSLSMNFSGAAAVAVAANDTIDVRMTNNDDSSQSFSTGTGLNHITIYRLTDAT